MEVTNTPEFLHSIRQKFWRGQGYDAMYDNLNKILITKIHAEKHNLEFRPDNFYSLWEEVKNFYRANSDTDLGDVPLYPDNRLRDTVEEISKYEIANNRELWHIMNFIWLKHACRKENGQYFTPPFIRKLMVNIYMPEVSSKICDPCAGSGSFLISAAETLDYYNPKNFFCFDVDIRACNNAKLALMSYKHKSGTNLDVNTTAQDSLKWDWPKMDFIYTNVPFGVKVTDPDILKMYETSKTQKQAPTQIVMLEKCLKQLNNSGRFTTVIDRGLITNKSLQNARKVLSSLAYLELVVELSSEAFEYFAGTNFVTYLLFFKKEGVTPDSKTYFAKVENLGYGTKKYDLENELKNWESSDFAKVLVNYQNKNLPSIQTIKINESGNWHFGAFNNDSHTKLKDVASFLRLPYKGENNKYPTIDRKSLIVVKSNLNPKSRVQALVEDCLLINRIVSDGDRVCCGIITKEFDGAGCTNENYVIKPNNPNDLYKLWYTINFNKEVQEYIRANTRGQGRGRIFIDDLINAPMPEVPEELVVRAKNASKLVQLKFEEASKQLDDFRKEFMI